MTNYSLNVASTVEIAAFVDTPIYADIHRKLTPRLVLKKGQQLVVPATVAEHADWGAVAEGGTVIGYVPLSYLDKHTAKAYAPPVAKITPPKTETVKAPVTPKTETAKAPTEMATPSASLPAESITQASAPPAAKAPVQKAEVVGDCKISVRHVKGTEETIKYCKEPPKGWKVIEV